MMATLAGSAMFPTFVPMQPTGSPRFNLPGFPSYFGGKGAPATVRRIINLLPPHAVYIEPFLGSGRVMRHKRPALRASIGFEVDPALCEAWRAAAPPDVHVVQADALEHLERFVCQLYARGLAPSELVVYCDPPYLLHTRRDGAPVYHREWGDEEHMRFLLLVMRLTCRVIVSHLPCEEYATALHAWHTFTFQNATRRGLQTEQVWCNFPPGPELHEFTFIGKDFRERERIKRQLAIVRRRFEALPLPARLALLAMLQARDIGEFTR